MLLAVLVAATAALLVGVALRGFPFYGFGNMAVVGAVGGTGATVLLAALRRAARLVPVVALAAAAALFGPGAAATLALTLATALAIGLIAFGRPAARGSAVLLLRVAAGLALLAALLQLAMRLPVNWALAYLTLAAAAVAVGRRALVEVARGWWASAADPVPWHRALPAAALFGALLAATAHAAMPEAGYDALSNHLAVVDWVRWNGRWHFDVGVFDRALMPRAAGWLFAWAHVLGGEAAAKLLNAALLWLTVALVAAYAAEREAVAEAPTLLALFALAVTPMAVWVVALLFEETATAFFVTAALVSLALAWRDPAGVRQGAMTFLLLGAACASKVQALFFGGIGLLAVLNLFRGRRSWPGAVALAAGGAALFAAVGAVPYVVAWAETGHPFFPFSLRAPPDPRWIGLLSPDLLWRMAFRTSAFMESRDGAFGFQHLLLMPLLPLAGLLSPRGEDRAVGAALLLFAAGLLSQTQYARYLFYAMPGLLLLMPAAWAALGRAGRGLLTGALVLATALNVAADRAVWSPRFTAGQLLLPERFAAAAVPEERAAVAAVNATHGAAARVYFAGLPFAAGLEGSAVTVYSTLRHRLEAARTAEEAEAALRAEGITHVVTATARNANEPPVPVPPALERALAERAIEVPLARPQVRLFVLPGAAAAP